MASKYIKIYNDTVLKQTILQGYESQRTNENLGKISMGELAYTRDTSRLFIGNWTNQDNEKDSKYVIGGSLAGNRYLGLIDSKPLGHVSATGDNGCFPLDYENDTIDEANTVTEIGLFKKGSRFRQTGKFLNNNGELVGTIKGDGWDKEATYIDKYGVYSGDFTFDIFNNALILFDKNITTNENEQPIRKWIGDEETGKEVFYDVAGNDITQIAKKRTKLKNLTYTSTNDTSNKYPIYGNGYVVMRILEPDGVTIDYVDKQFSKGEPTASGNGNWSHNILKVNYPTDKIKESFNEDQFKLDNDGKIIFDTDGLAIGGASTTLPKTVNFGSWKLTFDKGDMNTTDNYYLSVNSNGEVTSSAFPEYSYTISLGNGLATETVDENGNKIDGDTIILSKNSTSATIKLKGQDGLHGDSSLTENPWFLNDGGSLSYSGIGGFQNNLLVITEDYEDSYKKFNSPTYPYEENNEEKTGTFTNANNIFSKVVTPYYETDTNLGLVFLKNPYPIQWNTTSTTESNHKGKWAVHPYITNVSVLETSNDVVVDSTSTNENGEYEFSKEEETDPNSVYYKRIPTHAQSVILEIHHEGEATIYTCKNYADATSTKGWSFPTSPNTYNKKEKIVGYSSGKGVETVEIPLYRDLLYKNKDEDNPKELYVKSFCFNIVSTGKVLINIIGYRV